MQLVSRAWCGPPWLARVPIDQVLVAPARFELTTPGLGNQCSIQLSYEAMLAIMDEQSNASNPGGASTWLQKDVLLPPRPMMWQRPYERASRPPRHVFPKHATPEADFQTSHPESSAQSS